VASLTFGFMCLYLIRTQWFLRPSAEYGTALALFLLTGLVVLRRYPSPSTFCRLFALSFCYSFF
jgi:hypothetical protein